MNQTNILERNLLALTSFNPETSRKLNAISITPDITIKLSRTGLPVPVLSRGGRQYTLHSSFDPEKEGTRLAETVGNGSFLVFFGLGAAYQIKPFLSKKNISRIVIIEKDLSLLKSILNLIDFTRLFLDPRVTLIADCTPEEIRKKILEIYIPAVTGNLETLPLRPRVQIDQNYFSAIIDSLKNALSSIADDYTVQSHFGKTWFKNTIHNIEAAEKSSAILGRINKAIITGAGPSLEDQIPFIKKERTRNFLIATDTSFSTLMHNGIRPDAVISIDCQHISYHHFLQHIPADIPLVVDLASPPLITRLSPNILFFTSGHPLSQYVNVNFRRFPQVDTSGGNVSHAAVSLAGALGAKNISLAGMDFSYPQGKSYARGSYLYPYFGSKADRLSPLESQFMNFVFHNKSIITEVNQKGYRYITKPMISYKERLENSLNQLSAKINQLPGDGATLECSNESLPKESPGIVPMFASGKAACTARDFLNAYYQGIKSLSIPDKEEEPLFFNTLKREERDLWTTLLPAAAFFRRHHPLENPPQNLLLKEVREWSLNTVSAALNAFSQDFYTL